MTRVRRLKTLVPAANVVAASNDADPMAGARQAVTLALRPEKLTLSKDRPEGPNAVEGMVKDLAYFGKDSLYRISLPSGALVQAHAVNARRGTEAVRVADWDDRIWLGFDPGAAIVLAE